jgi:ADP-dependent NAD(P)H-hydrate dehydratase / NAD(P)H-hydrate epimerase
MKPVLTPAEMAEADRRTIAAGTPVEVLMERAGRAVAWEVRQVLGGTYGARAAIVCGKGNNGGDGLVAARVLEGWGVRVDVLELADGPDDATVDRAFDRADVAVDAMYGTGFQGALEGAAAHTARRTASLPTVAVDIPSGIDGLTGRASGDAVRAVSTVTFAAPKPGLCFEPGRTHAGVVHVADIGIDLGFGVTLPLSERITDAKTGGAVLALVERADVREWLVPRAPDANKWSAGLLVVGGSGGMTGAPMFVSHAAMRVGSGIVWCGVPGSEAAARAAGSEVVVRALPADVAGAWCAVPDDVLDALARFRAVAIGPGLGTAPATQAAVRELVARVDAPLVLDADGLNAFAGDAGALRSRRAPTIITPHEGEFARLLGDPVGADRVDAARRLAAATGTIALLKGPGTVVANADGGAVIEPVGDAALATAGSGDVLTGIIAGLLARGVEPFAAAAAGAFLHGRAARRAGHTGLVAGDLVAALPRVLDDLEEP